MTSNAAHTPGPLHVGEFKTAIYDERNVFRAQTFVESGSPGEKEANARRLVACWNAAHDAGLSTEVLEARVVKEMVETLRETFVAVRLAAAFPAVSNEFDFSYVINKMSAILATLSNSPKQSQEEH